MVGRLLRKIFGESPSMEEQAEIILSEITDSRDKVFVWQFLGWDETEMQKFYEEHLEDVLAHGMHSQHVVVSDRVEIDEIVIDDVNPVKIRDGVYEYVKEE